MRSKVVLVMLAVSLIAISPMVLNVSGDFPGNRGPVMDVLRQKVWLGPDQALVKMLNYEADISPDQIRTGDIQAQKEAGMTATLDLGFHMGYIAYNVRDLATINDIRAYRGLSPVSYWPLHDAEFRHALIHSYDQMTIIPPLYGYIVTPVRSLVPPAQSKYYNINIPEHAFNQGKLFPISERSPPGEHSTVGILLEKGYTFVDADGSDSVTDADYWLMPNGDPLPEMVVWTPLEEVAPTSFQHGAKFVADLKEVGLAATVDNGMRGLRNEGRDFDAYLDDVFGTATTPGGLFDAFMVFHGMGRLPDQLFYFVHSSQDSWDPTPPGPPWDLNNAPGVRNGTLDELAETILYSLDLDEIEAAAKEIQFMLYTPDKTIYPDADDFALAWMMLYSRAFTNVFTNDLRGAVKSPGFGSDNGWTFLNLEWATGTGRFEDVDKDGDLESVVIYINGLPPDTLNPLMASTAYEWNIISPNLEGLYAVNPYTHDDLPWVATDWDITEIPDQGPYANETWMRVDFTLRSDVFWADGYQVTASDVEFNLEFFRDWQTINFAEQSLVLEDVVVTDTFTGYIIANKTGLSLFYDYMGTAITLPPQIWDRDWTEGGTKPKYVVHDYHPDKVDYGTDMAPGYGPGPWADQVAKNLFGAGPYIFRFYDDVGDVDDQWANRNYFLTKTDVENMLKEMFHEQGDVNRDGKDDAADHGAISIAFFYTEGEEPDYNVDADLNLDTIVDHWDFSVAAYHLGWQREWPLRGT